VGVTTASGNVRVDVSITGKETASAATSSADKALKKLDMSAKGTAESLQRAFGRGTSGLVDTLKTKLASVEVPNFAAAGAKILGVVGIVGALAAGLIAAGTTGALLEARITSAFGSIAQAQSSLDAVGRAVSLDSLTKGVSVLKQAGAEVQITAAEMAKLTDAATAIGVSGDEAFTKLSEAIARGEASQLSSIGLFVNGEVVMRDYAKAIGKTADQLTFYDRQAATAAAATDALAKSTAKSADNFNELDKLGRAFSNLGTIINVGVLSPLAGALATALNVFVSDGESGVLKVERSFQQAGAAVADYDTALQAAIAKQAQLPGIVASLRVELAKLTGAAQGTVDVLVTEASVAAIDSALAESRKQLADQQRALAEYQGAIRRAETAANAAAAKIRQEIARVTAELEAKEGSAGKGNFRSRRGREAIELDQRRTELRRQLLEAQRQLSDVEAGSLTNVERLTSESGTRAELEERINLLVEKRAAVLAQQEAQALARFRSSLGDVNTLLGDSLSLLQRQDVVFKGMTNSNKLQKQLAADKFEIQRITTILGAEEIGKRLEGERAVLALRADQLRLAVAAARFAASFAEKTSSALQAAGLGKLAEFFSVTTGSALSDAEAQLATVEGRLAIVARGVDAAVRLRELAEKASFKGSAGKGGAAKVAKAPAAEKDKGVPAYVAELADRLGDLRGVVADLSASDLTGPLGRFDRDQAQAALDALTDYANRLASIKSETGELVGINALLQEGGVNPLTLALQEQLATWNAIDEATARYSATLGELASTLAGLTQGDADFSRLAASLGELSTGLSNFASATTDLGKVDAAIQGLGKFTAALFKDQKAQALTIGIMETIRAAVAFASYRYGEGALHVAAAGLAFAFAGKKSGSSGAQGSGSVQSRPVTAKTPLSGGGNVTINVQGFLVGSAQEAGVKLQGLLRSASGSGFAASGAL
jgi:hypothetical protein